MQNQKAISNRVVILTFGDIHKSQFTIVKPILDEYGFKGSFFVPCNMVGKDSRMDWNDIETLYNEGHDIEAKSDKNLIDLSPDNLDFQVSQPKRCLSEHGIDPTTCYNLCSSSWKRSAKFYCNKHQSQNIMIWRLMVFQI